MGATETRRQRTRPTRDQTRRRLIEAAGPVFAARGYSGASLDEVAAAAGLTKGAVYSSFSSKDELFYALMEARISERLRLFGDPLTTGSHPSTEEAIGELASLSSQQADWHLLFIEFWARAVRDPGLLGEFTKHRRAARKLIADLLDTRAAQMGVSLPAPSSQLAVAILALSNGMAIERLADPEEVEDSDFSLAVGLLLRGGSPE